MSRNNQARNQAECDKQKVVKKLSAHMSLEKAFFVKSAE